MPLTDAQIERYSRQIIVPGFGGHGQERLLAAMMLLAGDFRDLEQPLAYLVGAGVGSIHLSPPQLVQLPGDLLEKMRALNPDVSITPHSADSAPPPLRFDLALLLPGSDASRANAATLATPATAAAFIIARLGDSPRLAILPDPSSCPRCAYTSLVAAPDSSAAASSPWARFAAMLAATEALKLLSGFVEQPSSVIIDFDGYATRTRALTSTCSCAHSFPSP